MQVSWVVKLSGHIAGVLVVESNEVCGVESKKEVCSCIVRFFGILVSRSAMQRVVVIA